MGAVTFGTVHTRQTAQLRLVNERYHACLCLRWWMFGVCQWNKFRLQFREFDQALSDYGVCLLALSGNIVWTCPGGGCTGTITQFRFDHNTITDTSSATPIEFLIGENTAKQDVYE